MVCYSDARFPPVQAGPAFPGGVEPAEPGTGSVALRPAETVPNPHVIWLTFRVPLPSGHFNIGIGDLILVTALAENFRRMAASWPVAAVPGVFAVVVGTLIASFPVAQSFAAGSFSEALVPYLTAGLLAAVLPRALRTKRQAASNDYSEGETRRPPLASGDLLEPEASAALAGFHPSLSAFARWDGLTRGVADPLDSVILDPSEEMRSADRCVVTIKTI